MDRIPNNIRRSRHVGRAFPMAVAEAGVVRIIRRGDALTVNTDGLTISLALGETFVLDLNRDTARDLGIALLAEYDRLA